ASMLPEEGGYYRWVDRAFGRFWAFQNGWLTWMYSLVDMAIYPVLFSQYLHYFLPAFDSRLEWLVSLAVIWGATWINLRGSVRVEVKDASRSYPRALAIALPFVTLGYFIPLMTALGATDWTNWTDGGWPEIAAAATGSAGRWIAIWIALGGMVSALALFNALL